MALKPIGPVGVGNAVLVLLLGGGVECGKELNFGKDSVS